MQKKHSLILLSILLLAFYLRFNNFPYRYGLGIETIRDAVVGIEGARQLQFPLTGAFSSLGPFTFGPLYSYQLIIATLIMRTLYAPWIYLGIISFVYIFLIYKIGDLLKGPQFGLILAFLAAISPPQIISGTHLTAHNMTNLFAVLSVYIFLLLVQKERSYWLSFALGISIGTGMNMHYQMGGLMILPVILFIIKPKKYIHFVTALAGVVVTFIPLLTFELNNHWFNTRNIIDYLLYGRQRIYVPNRWLFYVRDFWPGFWADSFGIPIAFAMISMVSSAVLVGYLYIKKRLSLPLLLLVIAFLCNFIVLRYYWGPRFYGYLNFLRPFVFIFVGMPIYYLWEIRFGRALSVFILFLILYFATPRIMQDMAPDSFSEGMYKQMDIAREKIGYKSYEVYGCSKNWTGSYIAQTYAMVFINELHNKQSSSPSAKLGLTTSLCENPVMDNKEIEALNEQGVMDFSTASDSALLEKGWGTISFKAIYNDSARWWLNIQP